MGVDHTAYLIHGIRLSYSDDLINKIKSLEPNYHELYEDYDLNTFISEDIHNEIIEKYYPGICIINTQSTYNCPLEDMYWFLCLNVYSSGKEINPDDLIKALRTPFDKFNELAKILEPESQNIQPKIHLAHDIW